ncbi:unnamed protein product [Auanema sp. JU1783]|nr:unnamed protein product [Auanema sp. JU1783]
MSSIDLSPEDHNQSINYRSLEELVYNDDFEDIATIKMWCEKLQNFKLEGTESMYELQTLVNGLSYLMSYMFTAAEELKEVAERETSAMAEREDQWEEEKQELKEELETLRERITSRADAGESSEAFRAQINSLKEENRALQQLSRDRDRQMADQGDRFEALVARVDALTRERDTLIDYRAQSEDTISELRRRIFAKTEESTNEWETKKLKLRNEQAVTLSRQMQAVVAQNDELRAEVTKVSNALEEATKLMEESSIRISKLKEDLLGAEEREAELSNENGILLEKLEEYSSKTEQMENEALDSESGMKNLIMGQSGVIEELKDELEMAERELMYLREKIASDMTQEKELELEKLKEELVEATKMARELFGEHIQSKGINEDQTANLRIRLVQLEQKLRKGSAQNDELQKSQKNLEDELVKKDESHASLAAEIERLRELKFGDARGEVKRLETQLKLREIQISKMTNFCTMLQIELGRYAEREFKESPPNQSTKDLQPTSAEKDKNIKKTETSDVKKDSHNEEEQKEKLVEHIEKEAGEQNLRGQRQQMFQPLVADFEQQAMLISNLYYEIMKLIEENNAKTGQLNEMEHWMKNKKSIIDESKAQLKMAYNEIRVLKEQSELENYEYEHQTSSTQIELEQAKMEIVELNVLRDSIKKGGNVLERRTEEMSRKLIAEKMQNIRLSRTCTVLRARVLRSEEASQKMKEKIVKNRTKNDKHIANLQYDLDLTCMELAAMQHRVIHSIPLKQWEELMTKYKKVIKKEFVGTDNVEMAKTSIELEEHEVSLGKSMEDKTSNEQLMAKNEYLKKIISVLTDQNEFWNKETESLQKENEELKKFIEDIENESDLKSVLAAIEHRLLFTIREQQETLFDLQRETRKKRDSDEFLAKNRQEWMAERKRFVHMVVILQRALQQQRASNMASFTLEQMEKLKGKIAETLRVEEIALAKRREAEEIQEKLENQLMNQTNLDKARNDLIGEDLNRQRVEKMLQTAYTNISKETTKSEKIEKMIKEKEDEIKHLKAKIEDVEKTNDEYLQVISSMNVEQIFKKMDFHWEKGENKTKTIEIANVLEEAAIKDETDYEMDYDSSGSSDKLSERLVVKTIVQDNSVEFKQKLEQMKQTAEAAIRGYKEQLTQKEAEVASYRDLLLIKMNEPTKMVREKEIVTRELRVPDDEAETKLKQAAGEIARLKAEVEELQVSNKDLYRNRQFMQTSARKTVHNTSVQTDIQDDGEEDGDVGVGRIGDNIKTSERSSKKSLSQLDEFTTEKQDESLKYKNEIRFLKERLKKAVETNNSLTRACQKIKDEAMEQLDAKRRDDNMAQVSANHNMEVSLRMEIEQHRQEVQKLKKRLMEREKEIVSLNQNKIQLKKDSEEEVNKWNERKRLMEKLEVSQKKLKESNDQVAEFKDRLEKKEKYLEQIRTEEQSYEKEIQKMSRRLKEMRSERDSAVFDNHQLAILRDKIQTLQEQLHGKDKELSQISSNFRRIDKENSELKERMRSLTLSLELTKKEKHRMIESSSESQKKQVTPTVKEVREVIIKDSQLDEVLKGTRRQLRLMELKYKECDEKLKQISDQHSSLTEEYSKVVKKLASRDERSTGAVVVLGDKLQAKDKEITQLKSRISSLERRLSQ